MVKPQRRKKDLCICHNCVYPEIKMGVQQSNVLENLNRGKSRRRSLVRQDDNSISLGHTSNIYKTHIPEESKSP